MVVFECVCKNFLWPQYLVGGVGGDVVGCSCGRKYLVSYKWYICPTTGAVDGGDSPDLQASSTLEANPALEVSSQPATRR